MSNRHAPHDEQVAVGFNVTCAEAVVVLVLLEKYRVGIKGCMDNVEGARGHCFKDYIAKEGGRSEHADSIEIDVTAGGGSRGTKGVGSYICCSNYVRWGLCALGLGCYGSAGVESNNLGFGTHPKESCYLVGGLEDLSTIVFEVVKDGDFFLIVGNDDEVMVLTELLYLAVQGGVVGNCFGVFCHVAVADCIQWG